MTEAYLNPNQQHLLIGTDPNQIPDIMAPRIEQAMADSEYVASPEVARAYNGYFVDHARLASVVSGVAERSLPESDAVDITLGKFDGDSAAINVAMKRLTGLYGDPTKRQETLELAAAITTDMLYAEESIGALVTTEEDLAVIPELHQKIVDAAVGEGVAFASEDGEQAYWAYDPQDTKPVSARPNFGRTMSPSQLDDRMNSRRNKSTKVQADTRFAGQLLFHNSAHFDDIAAHGFKLTSRTGQLAKYGTFNALQNVLDGPQHSNLVHWAEKFDPSLYRSFGMQRNDGKTEHPGAVAVPLADMVATAPFARNAHYGVVELKPDANVSTIPRNEGTQSIGVGGFDTQGSTGGDRVFLASQKAEYVTDAYNYELDVRASGSANLIMTQAEFDAGQGLYQPDKTGLKVLILSDDGAEAETQIIDLQRSTIDDPRYAHKAVVPLRQGVMEFHAEGEMPKRTDDLVDGYARASDSAARTIPAEQLMAAKFARGDLIDTERVDAERAKLAEQVAASIQRRDAAEMARTGETRAQLTDRRIREFNEIDDPVF